MTVGVALGIAYLIVGIAIVLGWRREARREREFRAHLEREWERLR